MYHELLIKCIFWCGVLHLIIGLLSLLIPKSLDWQREFSGLKPALKQMFWTYTGYVLVINLYFGIVSIFGAEHLLNGSFLAKCLTFFIALYWLVRILVQYIHAEKRKRGLVKVVFSLGEWFLVFVFLCFTLMYGTAFAYNLL